MTEVLSETSGVQAIRRRFSSLQEGFTFFDAPGGSQVPDEVGDAIAKRAARGQRQPRRRLRDQPSGQGDPRGGRGKGAPGSWAASRTRSCSGRT